MAELRLSHVIAGFVAVLVGYAGSVAIIYQATLAAGATPEQASSWMLVLGLACGISSIYLSLRHRLPVLTAWSTPGAALLVVALPGVPLDQAIGAFVVCGLLLLATGLTGWFEALNARIPDALANAMLAGVLFRFGVEAFGALSIDPIYAGAMIALYVQARRFAARFAVPLLLVFGLGFAVATGAFDLGAWGGVAIAKPVFVMPVFDISVLISIAIPLYLVTMSSQNMAGVSVLRGAGYRAPVSSTLNVTGLLTTLLAPFGCFAINFAAITAAICANEEAGEDPKTRYWAPVFGGFLYIVFGIFGAAVIGLFLAAPKVFVAVLAGLALLPTIAASLSAALTANYEREAALVTFLTTVSGISFLGIASPVWGLLFGALVFALAKKT